MRSSSKKLESRHFLLGVTWRGIFRRQRRLSIHPSVGSGLRFTDALGSVRQLTGATGEVTLANAYEPYGVLAQSAGSAQTSYGFTGEVTDPSGMVYLRARYYMPNDGRFLTRDTWMGDYNSPLSLNRWGYVEGNPVNRVDPMGLFSRELIFKNIDYLDFEHLQFPAVLNHGTKRLRYGFLALLLEADDYDLVSVGYLQLQKARPTIAYYLPRMIWQNCETIFVGGQPLTSFYETEVKSQREPWIWWRDTSASYYQLLRPAKPGSVDKIYIDGDYSTDLPSFHSVDVAALVVNFDLLVDLDGNFYFSAGGGAGESGGLSYTESYLCRDQNCFFSPSEIKNSIKGYCLYGGGQIIAGYQLSFCGFLDYKNATAVNTFSSGFGGGYTLPGLSFTFPINSIFPQNAEYGWRAAIDARRNGIHRSDIRLYP